MNLRHSAILFVTSVTAACTGADGTNGNNGADGEDGSIVQTTSEPAGANCATGGTKLEIGQDTDGNGTLSGAEIEQTVYVCNGGMGNAGTPGATGKQSLISVTTEPAGANCSAGGQKIEHGVDDDNNGTLEAGEVDGTAYVCNGIDGLASLVATASESPGANCAFGGTKVTSGVDDNDNGTLDAGEVDATAYVCNAKPIGTLYFSQDSNGNGLFRLNDVTGQATNVGVSGVTSSTVGLTYDPSAGVLLGSKWSGLVAVNPDGSGFTDRGGVGTEALAYDYVNNVLYGGINGQFFTIDKTNGALVANLTGPGIDGEGLAFRADTGTIYAIGGSSADLHAYNIAAGTWSVVGPHGLNFDNGGLAYDPWNNILYAIGAGSDNLYRINPGTGQATLIGSTGLGSATGGLEFVPAFYP